MPLGDGSVEIGRSDANGICLTDRNVSRRHARLTVLGPRVWVENLQATWGTKRNKLLIREKTELTEGDVLQVGDYTLEIDDGGQARRDNALRDTALPEPGAARSAGSAMDGATAMINLADVPGTPPPAAGAATSIPEPSQPRLVVESDNLRGLELRVSKTPIVLGRVRENADLVLDHRSISKEHARLTRLSNGTWQILDLGSANGLKVNGEPYSKCDVQSGDRIELGHVTLRFLASGVATPSLEDVGAPVRSKTPIAIGVGIGAALAAVIAVIAIAGVKKTDGNDAVKAAPAVVKAATEEAPEAAGEGAAHGANHASDKADADHVAAPAPKAAEVAANSVTDALVKADQLRKTGEYDEALQVLHVAEASNQNNAQISLRIRQVEDARKWKAKLDLAESLLARDAARALEYASDAKAHLQADDPLTADAEKIIDAARAGLLEKHKPGKAEPHVKPEPKTVTKPEVKPEPRPEPEPVAKPTAKTGKDLYEEGRNVQMQGQTDAAIGLYLQAVKAGYGKAHKQLALLYQARNDKVGCAKNAKAYLEKNPSAGDADAMQQLLDKCQN